MQYLVYITIFLIPFYFFRFSFEIGDFLIKTNIFEVSVGVSFLLSLLFSANKIKDVLIRKNWYTIGLVLLFILSSVIGVLVAPDQTKAVGIFKGWFLIPLMLAWSVYCNFNKENIYKISWPILLSLITVSVWTVLQKTGLVTTAFYQNGDANFTGYIDQNRFFGPFESPNYLPMFLIPALFLSMPLFEKINNYRYKILLYFVYLLPLYAVILSQSRSGIVTIVISLLLYLNYRYLNVMKAHHRSPFKWHVFSGTWLIVNIYSMFFVMKYLADNVGSDSIRAEIYRYSTVDLLPHNWLFGLGLGNFQKAIGHISLTDFPFQQFGLPYAVHPHNLLLAMCLNLGILGLISFIFIVVKILQSAFSTDHYFRGPIVAAIFAVIIQGVFDTTYFKNDLSAMFWLIFVTAILITDKTRSAQKRVITNE